VRFYGEGDVVSGPNMDPESDSSDTSSESSGDKLLASASAARANRKRRLAMIACVVLLDDTARERRGNTKRNRGDVLDEIEPPSFCSCSRRL
jgi:hypothetical protein